MDDMREKDRAKKEKQFEAFMSGKTPEKEALISDDMSLQDIFKKLYGKTKEAGGKDGVMNSAKSSLNSLGSRLEKRR